MFNDRDGFEFVELTLRCLQTQSVFVPYFPPEEPQKFDNIHKIFGATNVAKLLNDLEPHQREDDLNSLAYEAEARLKDPVYRCVERSPRCPRGSPSVNLCNGACS